MLKKGDSVGVEGRREKKSFEKWRKGFLLIGLSFEIAVLLYFCVYIGQKGDRYFGTGAWITAIFVFLALGIWFYQLVKLFR